MCGVCVCGDVCVACMHGCVRCVWRLCVCGMCGVCMCMLYTQGVCVIYVCDVCRLCLHVGGCGMYSVCGGVSMW